MHLGGSMLANKTFLFVDQSSPDFFPGTRVESLSITFLSHFGYLVSFRRYSWSKSKVVKNRAEFWTFFSSSQILGSRYSKSYTNVMSPASWHVVWKMFCGDTPTSPEVIVANTLNFKPNLNFHDENFFGGPPSQLGCALGSLGQSLARIKILEHRPPKGRNVVSPEKSTWVAQF